MSEPLLKVGAAEANRSFSKLLRRVREEGARVTITSHGEPVAELAPPSRADEERERSMRALAALRAHRATYPPIEGEAWTKDEIYDYLDE